MKIHGSWAITVNNNIINKYVTLPDALSLDPELIDASASGLCASYSGLAGVGGVNDDSGFSICIRNVIWIVFTVMLKIYTMK